MGEIFKLSDIKAGYLLQVKNLDSGDVFNMTVAPGEGIPEPKNLIDRITLSIMPKSLQNYKAGDLACCCPEKEEFWPLAHFGEDLRANGRRIIEIVAVYGYTSAKLLLANSTERRELLWQREAEKAEAPAASAMLTPNEFRHRMKDMANDSDVEASHAKMDDLMCDQLRSMGYGAGVAVFENAKKWYA